MKVVVVVDMQNDFIDGALGSKEAVVAKDNLCKWIRGNITTNDKVIFTRDTHDENYENTQEGRNLPIRHCIKETYGWKINEDISYEVIEKDCYVSVVDKLTFGSLKISKYMPFEPIVKIDEIIICGVCTDICVISNALILKAQYPEIPISVIANCCAGLTPEKHEAALSVMESCQIKVVRE